MVQSRDVIRSYPLIGEKVPVWLVSILALLGIFISVVAAWYAVPKELQSEVVVPWIAELDGRYQKISDLALPDDGSGLMAKKPKKKQVLELSEIAVLEIDDVTKRRNTTPRRVEEGLKVAAELSKDKSIILPADDCPPLIQFTFRPGSIKPLASELTVKMAKLTEWLRSHPNVIAAIDGYASSVGSDERNLLLSYRRSKAVYNMLTKAGIAHGQLTTRAFGEQATLPGEHPSSGKNRRVSIRVDGTDNCRTDSTDGSVK